MTARSQGPPVFQSQASTTQHLRERQRFFEDVLQHDVDLYYPHLHLRTEHWRPPLDSVSSMEVNIDSLELSEPLDIIEMDPSDAFQHAEDPISPPTPTADILDNQWLRLHPPFSPRSDQPPGCDIDTTDGEEEPPCEQSLEHNAQDLVTPETAQCDPQEINTPEIQ
ncbi:dysbindin domain-containing protein 2-like [Rhinophrynus dorsalis]